MAANLFDRFRVIDIDAHVTEPADWWASRGFHDTAAALYGSS